MGDYTLGCRSGLHSARDPALERSQVETHVLEAGHDQIAHRVNERGLDLARR